MTTQTPSHDDPVLVVREARKSFGSVQALSGIDLHLGHGEILALLGDNGAGKSTLIKAIAGVHTLDEGEILVEGKPTRMRSAADARALGIETVYQDLAVCDNLNAMSNFYLGREKVRPRRLGQLGLIQRRKMAAEWSELMDRLKVVIRNPDAPLGLMSGGQRQAVAVARAVAFARRIVILDEPTAALGLRESRQVLDLVRKLPDEGISVILISHNLEHVADVAHRATVLRQGRNVGEAIPTAENHEKLVSLIVGATTST